MHNPRVIQEEVETIEAVLERREPVIVPYQERNLPALCRRYRIGRDGLHKIRRFLGHPTPRNKHWYSEEEVQELDYYYAACHAWWGERMRREDYEKLVLDRSMTFNEFLLEEKRITYQQYLEYKQHRYPDKDLFGA